jgi:actin-like ATPase involved in cell morphogenesis
MKHFINVEGYSDIVREESSQAIINTDTEQYRLVMKRRELMRNQKEEIQVLKNEVTEIKNLLQNIVEKLHG